MLVFWELRFVKCFADAKFQDFFLMYLKDYSAFTKDDFKLMLAV